MPNSSVSSLTPASEDDTSGLLLASGGGSVDAARQAQLEAMEKARSEAVAERQRAIEEGARQYALEQQTAEEKQRALMERSRRQREDAESFATTLIIGCVVAMLAYMAYDASRT